MPVLSLRGKRKSTDIIMTAAVVLLVWLLQVSILTNFTFQNVFCNLPLTLTILWGFVFGTDRPDISADDLRSRSTGGIFLQQLGGGSLSGLLVGAFAAALFASQMPVYPLCYPLIGWIAGYFASRNFSRETLLCVPVVLLSTVLAELIMALQLWISAQISLSPNILDSGAHPNAWQFMLIAQSEPFLRLAQIAFPEALLNALIAPFVYFPLSSWHEFYCSSQLSD